MNQLDDYTRRALCAPDQPPPGAEERVLGAILGPVGAGPPDTGSAGGSGGAGSGGGLSALAHAAKIVGATLGLTAGGVALLAITAAGIREVRAPRQPPARIEAPTDAELPAAAGSEPGPAPESTAELQPQVAVEPAPVIKRAVGGRPGANPTAPRAPTVEAELALMKTARASTDPEQALAALEQHRRAFAAGVFAAERELLRVEQLCALGRAAQAEAVAAKFLTTYPDHPLRSRVEPGCGEQRDGSN